MEKRRQALVDMINQLGEVSMTQLRGVFPDVSEVTLRKDLKFLDGEKKIVRIHGGAKSIQGILQDTSNFVMRSSLHREEKQQIARKAASLIQPGCALYISSGTTCMEFARQLPESASYVFTDGVVVAQEIPFCPGRHVEMLGGRLNSNLMRTLGTSVVNTISKLRFNYAILGAAGFHPDHGIPQTTPAVAATVQTAVSRSDKVVVLMDSSKVNYIHSPWVLPFEDIDYVVSDDNLPVEVRELLEKRGITVL